MDQSKHTPNHSSQYLRRYRVALSIVLLVFAALVLFYFFHGKKLPEKPAASVVVSPVESKNMPVYITAIGNVVAVSTITVKTQINGLLMKVHFKEGQLVKKGEPLADIDDRPLLAQLTQYQGQLVRDEALLANALIDLKRYQRLWKQDSVSEQTLATQQALVKQYQGSVETDKGLIANTQVSLIWSHITAPIDGRLGLRLVDEGNLVQTTDTNGLVVITSLNPITVIFTLPEDDVPRLLPQILAGKRIEAEAWDRQEKTLLATGAILTIDNQIDTSTGTVKLRAQFDNKDLKLFPNQFVNIKLLVERLPHATTVPASAIQHGSKGDFVYLLNKDSTVSSKPVTTGESSRDLTIVQQGLLPGQQVVTEGADRLANGSRVRVA